MRKVEKKCKVKELKKKKNTVKILRDYGDFDVIRRQHDFLATLSKVCTCIGYYSM